MTDWKAKLKALGPCPEAYRWAIQFKTLREAWRMCERGDWMVWLIGQCGTHDMYCAIEEVTCWGFLSGTPVNGDNLCDAYICLDFMPNPPRLPEIQ